MRLEVRIPTWLAQKANITGITIAIGSFNEFEPISASADHPTSSHE